MEKPIHSFAALFDQLGLPSDGPSIDRFIETHRPLPARVALHEAGFWDEAQARLLKQLIDEDADWAEMADQLNTRLR